MSNLERKKKVRLFNSRKKTPAAERKQKVFRFCSVGSKNISVNNTTTILDPTRLPESDITKYIENCSVCFFDLATTGLSDDFEIAQVSAVDFDGLGLFDQYLYPNGSIRFGSSKDTGITKLSGKLF